MDNTLLIQSACLLLPLLLGLGSGSESEERHELPVSDNVDSPEIHSDGRVTFRLAAPGAGKVTLWCGHGGDVEMRKDSGGVWSVTIGPFDPGSYEYMFNVDGVPTVDPANSSAISYVPARSLLYVEGDEASAWDTLSVPHGDIHVHWYESGVTGTQRRMHVYTPPHYSMSRTRYPVLYLLHGWGNDDSMWTFLGRANHILDSLIAEGKAVPMIVVMPMGHTFDPFTPEEHKPKDQFLREFESDLLTEVIPFVEGRYRVRTERTSRAIAGLSMGGWQSLTVGLGNIDRFGWIGSFSMGMLGEDEFAGRVPSDTDLLNERLKLLWVGCGREDWLYESNLELIEALKEKNIKHVWRESGGGHAWHVWQRYLSEFAPMIFHS